MRFFLLLTFVAISLSGCGSKVSSLSPPDPVQKTPQFLPITAIATFPGQQVVNLEVARTPQQHELGLMYRPVLPDNQGMLFQFSKPQLLSFWMKNVSVPLDMVFLNRGVVQYEASALPCPGGIGCPLIRPPRLCDQVIELGSGQLQFLGLKVGDYVQIKSIAD